MLSLSGRHSTKLAMFGTPMQRPYEIPIPIPPALMKMLCCIRGFDTMTGKVYTIMGLVGIIVTDASIVVRFALALRFCELFFP